MEKYPYIALYCIDIIIFGVKNKCLMIPPRLDIPFSLDLDDDGNE
jgi:hypothetical protein